jgi:lysophospholipase
MTLLCSLAGTAMADPEEHGKDRRQADIEDFWKNGFVFGVFVGTGGVRLNYAAHRTPERGGALVVVSGRTEFKEKYAELLYDLRETGLSFFIYDHRGQGSSGRLLPDGEKGHVESFSDYVRDLELFIETMVRPREHTAVYLLAHSMGGTVSLLYAGRHQQNLKGLILSSPMLSINTSPFPNLLARRISRGAVKIGKGENYVFGLGPYEPQAPFADNVLTGSRRRYELNRDLIAENPHLALGGPTFGWLDESFAAAGELMRLDVDLHLPVLLLQGEDDQVVGKKEQEEFCGRLKNCRLVSLPAARHEVLMEKDEIRAQALQHIRTFIGMAAKERQGDEE